MKTPRFLKALSTTLVLTAAIGLIGCDLSSTPSSDSDRASLSGAAAGWNVVIVSIDTLRADRLNAYGYDVRTTSPAIDRLLSSGVQFDRAIAPRAMTWPSLSSMLTGLYPTAHGVVQNGYELPEGMATLPRILDDLGYQTGAFMSNMCRAGHSGWDSFACAGGSDGKVTGEALAWAKTIDPEEPFLLWAHYFGAHPPYYNGGDLAATQLDPGYEGIVAPKKGVLDALVREQTPLDEADLRHLDAVYDASVIGSDRSVEKLLQSLDELGHLERTIILFLADHGEDLWDHNGYLYHACSVYQAGIHVPLGFVAPGLLPESSRIADTVEMIDILPTTLDLMGIEPPAEQQGRSLVPYFEPDQRIRPRPAFSEYTGAPIRTVVDYPWSLVDNPEGITPVCFKDAPDGLYPIETVELYNLENDPLEQKNVASEHPEEVARLRTLIERRFSTVEPYSEKEQALPEDLKRELEALGYIAN